MREKLKKLECGSDRQKAVAYKNLNDSFLKNKGVLKALVSELGVVHIWPHYSQMLQSRQTTKNYNLLVV